MCYESFVLNDKYAVRAPVSLIGALVLDGWVRMAGPLQNLSGPALKPPADPSWIKVEFDFGIEAALDH